MSLAAVETSKRSARSSKRPKRRAARKARQATKGFEVIRWIEIHCVHTQAQWYGQPFRLLPWQKRWILRLFAVGPDGLRIVRWALLGVPKKNGKTELIAALGLYFLLGDGEPAPLIVCAAASDEQADLVFAACKTMCKLSPTLRLATQPFEDEILSPSNGGKLKRVAAAAGTNDGPNIYVALLDELHEWQGAKGRQIWNVLTQGGGVRRQPLVVQITTAGFDEDSICWEQYDYGSRVASGEIDHPSFLFQWEQAPESADWKSPKTWQLANPSYGTLVQPAYLEEQMRVKAEAIFRRYFLNQWTDAVDIWIPNEWWDPLLEKRLKPDPSKPAYVGIDVGLNHDSSAVMIAQRLPFKRRIRTLIWGRIWENPYPPNTRLHAEWKLELVEVRNYLAEIRERFPEPAAEVDGRAVPGPAFGYDKFFFEESAQELERAGFNMVDWPQNDSHMVPASQALYQLIKDGELAHSGDPALRRHIRNVTPKETLRGYRISKPRGSRKHIDAAVSSAVAAKLSQQQPPQKRKSVYMSRGLEVVG